MYDELLEFKITLLKQFFNNCQTQLEIIDHDQIYELEGILIKQDNIIDELKDIDSKIKTSFEEFENKVLVNEINTTLREIRVLQDNIIKRSKDLKEDIMERFKQMEVGKKAIYGGYIKPEPMSNGYYIDKKIGR